MSKRRDFSPALQNRFARIEISSREHEGVTAERRLERITMMTARLVLCALCLMLYGCSDQKAKELFETAAFEENQGNVPHAKQLYQELVNLYPSTKVAEIARARLADLDSRK
jgi:hypothetical protein